MYIRQELRIFSDDLSVSNKCMIRDKKLRYRLFVPIPILSGNARNGQLNNAEYLINRRVGRGILKT